MALTEQERADYINPIDGTKIAHNPAMLPYASSLGAPAIRPTDMGLVKTKALTAMEQQTELQYNQIQKQVELLAAQAQQLKRRVEISYEIYKCEMTYEPIINQTYYLYARIKDDTRFLSMVGPNEWGRSGNKNELIATVKMMGDHTWDVLDSTEFGNTTAQTIIS